MNRTEGRKIAQLLDEILDFDNVKQALSEAGMGDLKIERTGKFRYDPTNGHVRLEVTVSKPNAKSAADLTFINNCHFFDLKEDDLGRVVTIHGTQYKITGLKPRATKRPVVMLDVAKNKHYVFDIHTVLLHLNRKMSDANVAALY